MLSEKGYIDTLSEEEIQRRIDAGESLQEPNQTNEEDSLAKLKNWADSLKQEKKVQNIS
jgi:hypothetical protein